jgi:hypothetical protein
MYARLQIVLGLKLNRVKTESWAIVTENNGQFYGSLFAYSAPFIQLPVITCFNTHIFKLLIKLETGVSLR